MIDFLGLQRMKQTESSDRMPKPDYFRGDQKAGITAPNLAKGCDYADHIVNARGKRTAFTSVSLDRQSITRFGEVDYLLLRDTAEEDGHLIIEHERLIDSLTEAVKSDAKAERLKASQALRYAKLRKEGLVKWSFNIESIERKDIITFAHRMIQKYFKKI